ncbi:low-temperature-induced 65 kDa protein [Glycine max]|nr:low-temperature-induced 65 kDa protein [Glycine max]
MVKLWCYIYDADTGTTQSRDHPENTGSAKPSTISSATSAIADNAISAKNTVTSKLGYGDNNTEATQTSHQENTQPSTISLATVAIADKAVSAKNTVTSKLRYGDNTETKKTQTTQTRNQLKNTGNEKPSTISSATSAIADKAVSAKNTVASKLGFGDAATTTQQEKRTDHVAAPTKYGKSYKQEKRTDHAAAPTEYGKSVAQSLTEKLAPVSGKVAGAGSGVKSKVSGTQTSSMGVEQDKGVSVKDYLVDKLRPGDEDRALSEVISETLHKKELPPVEVTEEGVRKVVSDAVHKREDDPERRMEHQRILGKVTESEEVKRRLGGESVVTEKKNQEMYVNSPGKGVVDKLKGVVGTWFTNPAENQSSQDSSMNYEAGRAEVEQVNQGAAGERRLQESSN